MQNRSKFLKIANYEKKLYSFLINEFLNFMFLTDSHSPLIIDKVLFSWYLQDPMERFPDDLRHRATFLLSFLLEYCVDMICWDESATLPDGFSVRLVLRLQYVSLTPTKCLNKKTTKCRIIIFHDKQTFL